MDAKALIGAAVAVTDASDSDVFLLNARFRDDIHEVVTELVLSRKRRRNVVLVIVTEGGDPDIAYRIARVFQDKYEKFVAIVSGWCKSAGTLCVLGANEVAFGDFGELGPLDIQYSKRDEIGEVASGLVVTEALNKLQTEAFRIFEKSMLGIISHSGGQVSFKLASEVAARLAIGLCEPLYRQIDPVSLGDLERANTIAKDYGKRLLIKSKNATVDKLIALAESYPSHGFVIDFREAELLFKSVRPCTEAERKLLNALGKAAREPAAQATAMYLSPEVGEKHESGEGEPDAQASNAPPGDAPGGAGGNEGDPQGAAAAGATE